MSLVIETVGIPTWVYPLLKFWLNNCRIVKDIHGSSYPKKSKISYVTEMEGVPVWGHIFSNYPWTKEASNKKMVTGMLKIHTQLYSLAKQAAEKFTLF